MAMSKNERRKKARRDAEAETRRRQAKKLGITVSQLPPKKAKHTAKPKHNK